MSFNPLISLARNAKRQRMEMQCDPQWVLDLAAERDQLRAELEAIRGQQSVAWRAKCNTGFVLELCLPDADDDRATLDWEPLYALPPQQPDAVSVPREMVEAACDMAANEADEHRQCMATYKPQRQEYLDEQVRRWNSLLSTKNAEEGQPCDK